MPTLVSPGVSVSVTDESFFIPAAASTVPLFFIATAAYKLQPNGDPALGTQQYNVVRTMTSLEQSVRNYGTPVFFTDSNGNPHHGDGRNEYGLLAMNQYLGVGNLAYCVRANINTNDRRNDVIDLWQIKTTQNAASPLDITTELGAAYLLEDMITDYIAAANVAAGAIAGQKSYQIIDVNGAGSWTGSPGSPTGLANDATVYTANVTVHNIVYPITVTGSAAQTYTDLLAAINADLGGFATATLDVDGNIKISAFATTTSFVINVADADAPGSPNTALFSNLNGFVAFNTAKGPYKFTVTQPELLSLAIDALDAVLGKQVVGLDTLWGDSTFATLRPDFIEDHTAVPLPIYESGYNLATTGDFLGLEGRSLEWVANTEGQSTIETEWTAAEARSMLIDLADDFQFTVEFLNETSLGSNDASRRASIAEAIVATINSNQDIRAESFEFNLILAPGYHEPTVVSAMAALSADIKEEAMVIADTPMFLDPEYVVNWGDNVEETGRIRGTNIAYYYPGGLTTNLDGRTVFCAASGIAMRTITTSDNNSELWFAPAGVRRGVVTGISAVGYLTGVAGNPTTFVEARLNEGQRDALYKYNTNINPIVNFPTRGILVWGQKTSAVAASARDRINVERMIMHVRRQLRKNTISYIFEPNDQLTRDDLKATVDGFLGDILIRRGLFDFATVCDESNNTPERIDRNEMYIDVALKPAKAAEFLFVPIRIVNTGTDIN